MQREMGLFCPRNLDRWVDPKAVLSGRFSGSAANGEFRVALTCTPKFKLHSHSMHWLLVHTKPRADALAVEHLDRQGFEVRATVLLGRRSRVTVDVWRSWFQKGRFERMVGGTGIEPVTPAV